MAEFSLVEIRKIGRKGMTKEYYGVKALRRMLSESLCCQSTVKGLTVNRGQPE